MSTSTSAKIVPQFTETVARVQWNDGGSNREVFDVLRSNVPVIVENAFGQWPAAKRWTPEYLRDHYGDFTFNLKGRQWRMQDFAQAVMDSSRDKPAPYLHNYPLDDLPTRMRSDIGHFPSCLGRNWLDNALLPQSARRVFPELYFGGTGAIFPVMHYDDMHMHAVLMQIYGEKEYMAFAPDQTPFVYSRGGIETNKSALDDPEGADPARFPLYEKARGARFRLFGGEMLFVPAGWWHTVRIISPSITVSVNFADKRNWHDYALDYRGMISRGHSPVIASTVYAYMTLLGLFI